MKFLKFLMVGIIFGIVMAKAEIISWYRIYEMFQFDSFHMYGVIGSAVVLGILGIQLIKKFGTRNIKGLEFNFGTKKRTVVRYLLGGAIFGLGWGLSGACPGPMFVLVGYGYFSILIVIIGALIGTFIYGLLRKHLPH